MQNCDVKHIIPYPVNSMFNTLFIALPALCLAHQSPASSIFSPSFTALPALFS